MGFRPFTRSLRAEVAGHDIEVVNHWFKGCAIFVDGRERARRKDQLALQPGDPFISCTIESETGPVRLDVHILAVLFVELELRANGMHVAGANLVMRSEGKGQA